MFLKIISALIIFILIIYSYKNRFQIPVEDYEELLHKNYIHFITFEINKYHFLKKEEASQILYFFNTKEYYNLYKTDKTETLKLYINQYIYHYYSFYKSKYIYSKKDTKLNIDQLKLLNEYKELGWKGLVKKYHPDNGGNEEVMKLIINLKENKYFEKIEYKNKH